MKISSYVLTVSILLSGTALANVPGGPEGVHPYFQTDADGKPGVPATSFNDIGTAQVNTFIVAGDAPCNPKVTVCDD